MNVKLDKSEKSCLFRHLVNAAKENDYYNDFEGGIVVEFGKREQVVPESRFCIGEVSETEIEWCYQADPNQTPEETGEDAEPSFSIYMRRPTIYHSWELDAEAAKVQYPDWYVELMASITD